VQECEAELELLDKTMLDRQKGAQALSDAEATRIYLKAKLKRDQNHADKEISRLQRVLGHAIALGYIRTIQDVSVELNVLLKQESERHAKDLETMQFESDDKIALYRDDDADIDQQKLIAAIFGV